MNQQNSDTLRSSFKTASKSRYLQVLSIPNTCIY
nr:MAG TPA: hypothetical protein [Caudoviricetes sp.]